VPADSIPAHGLPIVTPPLVVMARIVGPPDPSVVEIRRPIVPCTVTGKSMLTWPLVVSPRMSPPAFDSEKPPLRARKSTVPLILRGVDRLFHRRTDQLCFFCRPILDSLTWRRRARAIP
jgi:hypothetical protein